MYVTLISIFFSSLHLILWTCGIFFCQTFPSLPCLFIITSSRCFRFGIMSVPIARKILASFFQTRKLQKTLLSTIFCKFSLKILIYTKIKSSFKVPIMMIKRWSCLTELCYLYITLFFVCVVNNLGNFHGTWLVIRISIGPSRISRRTHLSTQR